ncbi:MAG TPA: AsnC family transcriptional regulator [Candidatus Competibacteraceae bacterium]|nr:AsnC family transcriptional regulator [Candidatus Competibacteraceae bacterium]
MDALERAILNRLQRGLPLLAEPFAAVAEELGCSQEELLVRLQRLLADGVLTRFGPLYNAERLGGGLTLAAMAVPQDELERVAARVNAFPEVAHNYAREHRYNLWFVLATESRQRVGEVIAAIEADTGYPVLDLPKLEEYGLELYLPV